MHSPRVAALRSIGLAIAVGSAIWAVAVLASGGINASIGGVRLASTDAARPLTLAAIGILAYAVGAGRTRLDADLTAIRLATTPARVVGLLSVVVLVVGLAHNEWTLGGPDSYSYVSQADLWLSGRLSVPVPTATVAPWPNAVATLTPFGYRSLPGQSAIAPMVGPGLPLLMAAFKSAGGHAAAFLVAPFLGACLVWATFLLGVRLGSPRIGAGAAWLITTSPTFLMMYRSQMSDVPAATFWAIATWCVLGTSVRTALGGGLSAAVAVLIRPNLVPLAAVLGLLPLVRGEWRRTIAFAAGVIPAALVIAAINTALFGSPLSSGYGTLDALFSLANVPTNLARYGGWLLDTQTPLALAGIVVLAAAPRQVWPTAHGRLGARGLSLVLATVWLLYLAYIPFDAWWFLRFLLPAWPALTIGMVAAVHWACEGRAFSWGRPVGMAIIVAVGAFGLATARTRHVFPEGEGEARYASTAMLVGQFTEPNAMVLASIHAGPIRYYGGRATLRFDLLDDVWLDRTVEWLAAQGRHPYLAIEDWEVPTFTRRFSGRNRLGDLRLAPVAAYRGYRTPGTFYVYDLLRPDGPTLEPPPQRVHRPRATRPAPPPAL